MGQGTDALTSSSLAVGVCLGLLILVLPRRFALAPMLMAGCYMTLGQSLVVGGFHLYLIRILILFGLMRVVVRRELFRVDPTAIDRVLIAWLLVSSFLYVLFDGTYVSVTERSGYVFDAIGIYALVRAVVRDLDDIVATVKMSAVIIIPLAVLFGVEAATGKNPFAVLGGVPTWSQVRDGQVRCQGPFKHSILAGTFGATAMPLFVGLWVYSKRNRVLATGAIVSAAAIVIASGSSGPFSALMLGIVGLSCWSVKAYMRPIRWGILAGLVALDIVMKAPIWFLIDRVSELVGGDGWYRSKLIDSAVHHFGEWWLIGTGYTAHWMETGIPSNPYSADIVNEFVNQGIRGGMVALLLFVWLLVRCFQSTGLAVRNADQSRATQFLFWSMGCTVLSHVASFFSVTYFDQIIISWYLIIGMIAALVHGAKQPALAPALQSEGVTVPRFANSGRGVWNRPQIAYSPGGRRFNAAPGRTELPGRGWVGSRRRP